MTGDRRWVVRNGDGATIAEIAALVAADDPACIADGRIFVGRTRALAPTTPVRTGDVVVVHAPRATPASIRILAERDGVVAAEKPAAMATIGDHRGTTDTLVAAVARALGISESALSTTSRLDVGVSGVVLFARTKDARVRLTEARAAGRYGRRYLAIASATPAPEEGSWATPIGRGADPRYRVANGREAAPALSRYRVVSGARAGACLLALAPQTGRTHQLRVHAAHAGAALFGDVPYGGPGRIVMPNGTTQRLARIALHARAVTVPDARGQGFVVEAEIPGEMRDLWAALDGSTSAWDVAAWP